MRDVEHGNQTREFSLHLTLVSSDIIKSGARRLQKYRYLAIFRKCQKSTAPLFSRQTKTLVLLGLLSFKKSAYRFCVCKFVRRKF